MVWLRMDQRFGNSTSPGFIDQPGYAKTIVSRTRTFRSDDENGSNRASNPKPPRIALLIGEVLEVVVMLYS